jgi:uncharacterized protein (DUF488 family)
MPPTIFTIGHSNHPIERFLGLLAQHQIEALADIRRYPGSKKFPHLGREPLGASLQQAGIVYHWFESLGGRRRAAKSDSPSPNLGLHNDQFRAFADYMLTDEFRHAIDELLEIAATRCTAIMCSESLFWRCHRRLVSDFLLTKNTTIEHIFPDGKTRPHKLTEGARIEGSRVTYPGLEL